MNTILKKKIQKYNDEDAIFVSATRLQGFNECGLKYRLSGIEKISQIGKKTEYGALGTAFHTVAQIMYHERNFDRRFMLGLWSQAFNEAIADPEIRRLTEDEKNKLRRQGYPLLQTFYSTEKATDSLRPALYNEKEFKIPYKVFDGVRVIVTGKIDRIMVHPKEECVEVCDYKTTKSKPMPVKQLMKTIQLRLYSWAYAYMFRHQSEDQFKAEWSLPFKNHFISMHYVRYGEKVEARIKKEDRIQFKQDFDKTLMNLFSSKFEPNRSDYNCKFCAYQDICPAWGNKLPDFKKLEEAKKNTTFELGDLRTWKKDGKVMKIKDFQIDDAKHMYEIRQVLNANQVGTGKTVESIALVEHIRVIMKREQKREPLVLLIAPKILLRQWYKQIFNWTGKKKKAVIIKGGRTQRRLRYGKRLWTLVNNEKIKSDIATINKIPWDIILVDEAQRIKGQGAQSSKIIRNMTAPWNVALTGTPIGSKLDFLFRIMSFVKPGLLGPWPVFKSRHIVYNKWTGKVVKFINLQEIRDKLGKHFIRRNKRDVWSELPEEVIIPLVVEMSKTQKAFYSEEVEKLLELINEAEHSEGNVVKFLDTPAGAKYIRLRLLLDTVQAIDPEGKADSPKFEALIPLVQDIVDENEKVIIFSQFTKVLDVLEREMKKIFGDDKILKITGQVKGEARERAQDLINNSKDHQILLMSDAGAYGLDLQGASYMINVELPESPDIITQRIGRISRPGQKSAMTIYNFVMKDTLEENIMKKRHIKAKLSHIIVDEKLDQDEVSFEEMKGMMSLEGIKELII